MLVPERSTQRPSNPIQVARDRVQILIRSCTIQRPDNDILSEPAWILENGIYRIRTLSYLLVPLIFMSLFPLVEYLTLFRRFPTTRDLNSVGVHVEWQLLSDTLAGLACSVPNFEACFVLTQGNHLYITAELQDHVLLQLEAQHPLLYQSLHNWVVARVHRQLPHLCQVGDNFIPVVPSAGSHISNSDPPAPPKS